LNIFLIGRKIVKCDQNYERFRQNLAKVHHVLFYGEGYWEGYNPKRYLPEVISSLNEKPDIILVHAPVGRMKRPIETSNSLTGFNDIDIPKVHVTGDYVCDPRIVYRYDDYLRYYKFNLIFDSKPKDVKIIKEKGLAPKVFVLPFSVDDSVFYDMNLERTVDVMASFAKGTWYTNRGQIQRLLARMNLKLFTDKVCFEDYVEAINRTKIFVCGNNINNNISAKYNEVLACNTLFIVNKPDELDEFGYRDGEHLVIYEDLGDMQDKVMYYLNHEDERREIAQNGMEFVRENYTNKVMVERFTEIVERELLQEGGD